MIGKIEVGMVRICVYNALKIERIEYFRGNGIINVILP